MRPAGLPVRELPCICLNSETNITVTAGGTDYEAAKAGTQNAEQYYKQGVCGMLAWGLDVFYFEAFDETWKPDSTGESRSPFLAYLSQC